jgi:hypothetical protein
MVGETPRRDSEAFFTGVYPGSLNNRALRLQRHGRFHDFAIRYCFVPSLRPA